MQWKSILFQSFITLVLLVVAFRFFNTSRPELLPALQNSCSEQIRGLEGRLGKIEEALAIGEKGAVGVSIINTGSVSNAELKEMMEGISNRLTRMEKELAASDSQRSPASFYSPVGLGLSAPKPSLRGDPAAFIQGLPEAKRRKVNEIFKEQAGILQGKLSSLGDLPHNLQAMKEIMDQNDRDLREKLKDVLDVEEYQKFQEYLPNPPEIEMPFLPGHHK